MAVIDEGEILLEAEPLRAVDDLRGRIWRRVISKEELPELERAHAVISTKLFAGRTGRPRSSTSATRSTSFCRPSALAVEATGR